METKPFVAIFEAITAGGLQRDINEFLQNTAEIATVVNVDLQLVMDGSRFKYFGYVTYTKTVTE